MRLPIYSLTHAQGSLRTATIISIFHQSGTFITIDELHRYIIISQSPQFTPGFTLGVNTFCEYGPMCNDMYPSL